MAGKTKAPVKQLMRGISKIGMVTKEMQESENIWLVKDIDTLLTEWDKNGYDLVDSFFVHSTERAYYVHYVLKLRKA